MLINEMKNEQRHFIFFLLIHNMYYIFAQLKKYKKSFSFFNISKSVVKDRLLQTTYDITITKYENNVCNFSRQYLNLIYFGTNYLKPILIDYKINF